MGKCCVVFGVVQQLNFSCSYYLHFEFRDYIREVKMNDDINLAIRMMDDERESSSSLSPTKQKRRRKSVLDPYRAEIIFRRMAGKTYRQIANFLKATYKVKTDHTLVYDFCKRCFSE